jgi:hypothetical protein
MVTADAFREVAIYLTPKRSREGKRAFQMDARTRNLFTLDGAQCAYWVLRAMECHKQGRAEAEVGVS